MLHEVLLGLWAARPALHGEVLLRGSLLTRQLVRPHFRSAKDIDFLATFPRDVARADAFIMGILAESDLVLERSEDTWLEREHPGRRYFVGDGAGAAVQVDIAFGDTIYYPTQTLDYQAINGDILALLVPCYEQHLAWKIHGLFEFWDKNFRWQTKDLYDIFLLHRCKVPMPARLRACIHLAFADKDTPLSVYANFCRADFGQSAKTQRHWRKFMETMEHRLVETDHLRIVAEIRGWLDAYFV